MVICIGLEIADLTMIFLIVRNWGLGVVNLDLQSSLRVNDSMFENDSCMFSNTFYNDFLIVRNWGLGVL